MSKILKMSTSCVMVVTALSPLLAQSAKQWVAAPVPVRILSSKQIFISNAGDECNPFGRDPFTGGPDRAYEQFYRAMKSWGHFGLASSPVDADLAFEIYFSCPIFYQEKLAVADPQLRLRIIDPKTDVVLWTVGAHAERGSSSGKPRTETSTQGAAVANRDLTFLGKVRSPQHKTVYGKPGITSHCLNVSTPRIACCFAISCCTPARARAIILPSCCSSNT